MFCSSCLVVTSKRYDNSNMVLIQMTNGNGRTQTSEVILLTHSGLSSGISSFVIFARLFISDSLWEEPSLLQDTWPHSPVFAVGHSGRGPNRHCKERDYSGSQNSSSLFPLFVRGIHNFPLANLLFCAATMCVILAHWVHDIICR